MATAERTVERSVYHPELEGYEDVNRDSLRLLSRPGPGYMALLLFSVALVGLAALAWGHQM
jgi:hypothetical protein